MEIIEAIFAFFFKIFLLINFILWSGISALILYNLWDYTKNKTDFKKIWPTEWIKWNPWI